MKRVTSVLIAVLLGAIATGIGVVPFLVMANQDRSKLAQELVATKSLAEQSDQEKAKIAEEANRKVEQANQEIERAEEVLKAAQEDQRLTAEAKRLAKPSARDLTRWKSVISLPLETKLLIPPATEIASDTKQALVVMKTPKESVSSTDADRWLSVMPYDSVQELQLQTAFTSSTPVSYLVNDWLLIGSQGTLLQDQNTFGMILRTRHSATTTHLIWIKDPGSLGQAGIEKLLATFEFN